jgi:DNA-binding transcriptional regulator YdaS (Cro superfamily)
MTLIEYFKCYPMLTKRKFAEMMDTDTATVFCLVKGRMPKLKHALAIEKATNGQVTCRNLYDYAMKMMKKKKEGK